VQPENKSIITVVDLCQRKFDTPELSDIVAATFSVVILSQNELS